MADIEFEGGLFADEPDQTAKLGGNIRTDSDLFKYLAVAVLLVIIIWIIFGIYKQIKIKGEDRNQRLTRIHFNNIRGEDFDDEAEQVIQYGEAIENPRAIDHYRIGTVYLLNARDHRAAHRHFEQALGQIIEGRVDTREAPFILNRIDDFRDAFVDFIDVDELPVQRAMMAQFENQQRQISQIKSKKIDVPRDDPAFKQKVMLSRQSWQSDSQNVHDAAIYEELRTQVKKVAEENQKIPNIKLHDYNEAVNWLRVRYKNEPAKLKDIEKVIATLNNNYPVGTISGINEKDVITAVWQRSYDPANKNNATQIREAMGDAVLDCVERGHVVCISGRTSKVWQALARVDKDEEAGVLKTKQAIINEIYQKAAKVVDDFVGPNGSASDILKESYNKNENTEQVKELVETMKGRIDLLKDEYAPLLDKNQLNITLEECKAVLDA